METLLNNRVLQAALLPWVTAGILKVIFEFIWYRKINLRLITSSGGMPSSHSALVCGLAAAIGVKDGVDSSPFALAVVLAMVVMYDAAGIRRAASMQARILNQIIDELFQGHPISEVRLREFLGHTPIQVAAGAVLGIIMAWWWMIRT